MREDWLGSFLGRRLVERPGIWGKMPGYADYVRHNVRAGEAEAWQKWASEVWLQRSSRRNAAQPRAENASDEWVHLEYARNASDQDRVPVAFVMAPGSLSFAPAHYVQGVVVDSQDRVGRLCPLVIYQRVTPGWGARTWHEASNESGMHLLFWLARLTAGIHDEKSDIGVLSRVVEEVCRMHSPGWRQCLGLATARPDAGQLRQVVKGFCEGRKDEAAGLKGVRYLPWADWPRRMFRHENPLSAYWVQDLEGRYVTASDDLLRLWRGRI